MAFEEELNALLDDIEMASWSLLGVDHDYDAYVWFDHTPNEDKPGQPMMWDDLQRLNDEYGVVNVVSESNGRTGSSLCVCLEEL